MTRIISSALLAAFAFALAAPASALPTSGRDVPSCDGDAKDEKKKEKNPSAAEPQCGGDKEGKKDEKKDPKNPSVVE